MFQDYVQGKSFAHLSVPPRGCAERTWPRGELSTDLIRADVTGSPRLVCRLQSASVTRVTCTADDGGGWDSDRTHPADLGFDDVAPSSPPTLTGAALANSAQAPCAGILPSDRASPGTSGARTPQEHTQGAPRMRCRVHRTSPPREHSRPAWIACPSLAVRDLARPSPDVPPAADGPHSWVFPALPIHPWPSPPVSAPRLRIPLLGNAPQGRGPPDVLAVRFT